MLVPSYYPPLFHGSLPSDGSGSATNKNKKRASNTEALTQTSLLERHFLRLRVKRRLVPHLLFLGAAKLAD